MMVASFSGILLTATTKLLVLNDRHDLSGVFRLAMNRKSATELVQILNHRESKLYYAQNRSILIDSSIESLR